MALQDEIRTKFTAYETAMRQERDLAIAKRDAAKSLDDAKDAYNAAMMAHSDQVDVVLATRAALNEVTSHAVDGRDHGSLVAALDKLAESNEPF